MWANLRLIVLSLQIFCCYFYSINPRSIVLSRGILSSSANSQSYRGVTTLSATEQTSLSKELLINSDLVSSLIEEMPLADKYSFLIQSYTSKLIESGGTSSSKTGLGSSSSNNQDKNVTLLDSINNLYKEMIMTNIKPIEKCTQNMIDATAIFCDCAKLGYSLQLAKAGGEVKVFGVGIGLLTPPILSADNRNAPRESVPDDNREQEIFYSGMVTGGGLVYSLIQVISWFDDDMKPWVILSGVGILAAIIFDVLSRNAVGIKCAIAGFDRLLMKDSEREAHSDGAAFMLGYLLGLPCFCFQPDLAEAIKMLKDNSNSLNIYKQPANTRKLIAFETASLTDGNKSEDSDKKSIGRGIEVEQSNPLSLFKSSESIRQVTLVEAKGTDEAILIPPESKSISLGRVLIWLMAPVAAEYLKYGKTVFSDPRRGERLLNVLESFQPKPKGGTPSGDLSTYTIPKSAEDRKALIDWAYYEAVTLVKQYGDLLENIREYLVTGTASVGECAILIEQKLAK